MARRVGFVRRAPNKLGGTVEMRVAHMRPAHVWWWQSHVQPMIDADPGRVDRHWNWLLHSAFVFLSGLAMIRRPVGYVLGMPRGEQFIPCGMALLLGRIAALDQHRKRSTGVWYLSTAPRAALTSVPDSPLTDDEAPRMLGQLTLDVAVTHSFRSRGAGRTALYADTDGGAALLDWYRARGMEVLPADKKIPPGPRRLIKPSDGRYCYFTHEGAIRASAALDEYR